MSEFAPKKKWIGQDTLNYTEIIFHGKIMPNSKEEFEFWDKKDNSTHKAKVESIDADLDYIIIEVYDYNEKGYRTLEFENKIDIVFQNSSKKTVNKNGFFNRLNPIWKRIIISFIPLLLFCVYLDYLIMAIQVYVLYIPVFGDGMPPFYATMMAPFYTYPPNILLLIIYSYLTKGKNNAKIILTEYFIYSLFHVLIYTWFAYKT